MKKILLSIFVCLATVAVSCGCKENKANNALLLSKNEKIDTLSYIVGLDVANSIEKNMIPMFKVDYDVMLSTLIQALDPNATIKVEGEEFNMENFREIGDKYMTAEFRGRVMNAQSDTTGTATIYANDKEKNIISAILGADIAYSVSNVQFNLEKRSLVTAINEVHNGKGRFTDEFSREYVQNYFTVVIPEQNKKESEAWLAEIEKQEGVNKTESGILYKIVNAGDNNIKAVNRGINCYVFILNATAPNNEGGMVTLFAVGNFIAVKFIKIAYIVTPSGTFIKSVRIVVGGKNYNGIIGNTCLFKLRNKAC